MSLFLLTSIILGFLSPSTLYLVTVSVSQLTTGGGGGGGCSDSNRETPRGSQFAVHDDPVTKPGSFYLGGGDIESFFNMFYQKSLH